MIPWTISCSHHRSQSDINAFTEEFGSYGFTTLSHQSTIETEVDLAAAKVGFLEDLRGRNVDLPKIKLNQPAMLKVARRYSRRPSGNTVSIAHSDGTVCFCAKYIKTKKRSENRPSKHSPLKPGRLAIAGVFPTHAPAKYMFLVKHLRGYRNDRTVYLFPIARLITIMSKALISAISNATYLCLGSPCPRE